METQQQTSSASLSREEVKTLGLSSLGGILEFYDFVNFQKSGNSTP